MNKLEEIKKIAVERGGKCLATEYLGGKTKLHFQCGDKHDWYARPADIKNKKCWCPFCAGRTLFEPLNELQKIATKRGGKLLSNEYKNSKNKLRFKCGKGHEWDAQPTGIKNQGNWCPFCAGLRLENGLDDLQAIAASKGGECLSKIYVNSTAKYSFRCGEGHNWDTSLKSLKKGSWCPFCVGLRLENGLDDLQAIAASKGGKCLSKIYVNSTAKYSFRCGEGHEWETTPSSLKSSNHWCPFCAGRRLENGLSDLQAIAASKGGECLSKIYVNSTAKYSFRCGDGHKWEATRNGVMRGSWCPQCSNKTEGLVRQFFECIFQEEFPEKAPAWLQEPNYPRRILDGYCDNQKIAFEYHGLQHFEHVPHFHNRGGKTLPEQMKRDNFVRSKCIANGVILFEIETMPNNFTKEQFIKIIRSTIENVTKIAINDALISKFSSLPFRRSEIEVLNKIAMEKGGSLLSEKYLGSGSRLNWRCAEGHEWVATPYSIKAGGWCAKCQKKRMGLAMLGSIDEFKEIAKQRGGECLSFDYMNSASKLNFRCSEGHEWSATPNNIKAKKSWCPFCAGQKPRQSKANNA